MATLHVENVVRDFDSWISVFRKFEAFRAQQGVRSYRLGRSITDPSRVVIDLDFDSVQEAITFKSTLEKIWETPQSKEELVSHGTPEIFDLVTNGQRLRREAGMPGDADQRMGDRDMIKHTRRLLPFLLVLMVAAPALGHEGFDSQCGDDCQADLGVARAATERYRDPTAAVLDGFVENGDCVPGPEGAMGYHWVKLTRSFDAVAVAEPEILLYAHDPSAALGRKLIGIEYFMPVLVNGAPYYGPEVPDPARVNPPPRLFGKQFDGPMPGHNAIMPWHYDLHVWAWEDNPRGLFAHVNPRVSC